MGTGTKQTQGQTALRQQRGHLPCLDSSGFVVVNTDGEHGSLTAATQIFNIGDFTTQDRPTNSSGGSRARHLHHGGSRGSTEYSVRSQIRRRVDNSQQLVALVNRVASGKLDSHAHAKAICCFLRSVSVLPLIAALRFSQGNQEFEFLHIPPYGSVVHFNPQYPNFIVSRHVGEFLELYTGLLVSGLLAQRRTPQFL